LLLSAAGAAELTIPPHCSFQFFITCFVLYTKFFTASSSQTFAVPANFSMVWKARVKHFDIGFALNEISDHAANHNNNLSPQSPNNGANIYIINSIGLFALIFLIFPVYLGNVPNTHVSAYARRLSYGLKNVQRKQSDPHFSENVPNI